MSDDAHRPPVSDVPPEGEPPREGVLRGARQSRALALTILRAASVGAAIGAILGIGAGVALELLGPERLTEGPPALVVIGVVLAFVIIGSVLGAAIAVARWDGAEQREIDARIDRGTGATRDASSPTPRSRASRKP